MSSVKLLPFDSKSFNIKKTQLSSTSDFSLSLGSFYRYVQFDSSRRNRNLYPNPANFVLIPSQYGSSSTALDAKDPLVSGIPIFSGITSSITASTSTNIFIDNTSNPSNIVNYYANLILELPSNTLTPEYRTISYYDNVTKQIKVNLPFTNPIALSEPLNIRNGKPVFMSTVGVSPSKNQIVLNNGSINFVGKFLRFRTGINAGQISLIIAYNGISNTATVSIPFTNIPNNGDFYEILNYQEDNAQPLLYSGNLSSVSNQQYNVDLLTISIPNTLITDGGNSNTYPYFFVKLFNDGNTRVNSNLLYSNNINSIQTIFAVPMQIFDSRQYFYNLLNTKSLQSAAISLGEAIRFTVTTPDGKVFESTTEDNMFPLGPNPDLQINALFGFELIDKKI